MRRALGAVAAGALLATGAGGASPAHAHAGRVHAKRCAHACTARAVGRVRLVAHGLPRRSAGPRPGSAWLPAHGPAAVATPPAPLAATPPEATRAEPVAPPPAGDVRAAPAPLAPLPRGLMVTATDRTGFRLSLSEPAVAEGTVAVAFDNSRGDDAHDLRIAPSAGGAEIALPLLEPGETIDRDVTLAPGSYRLYCGLPGHAAAGMRATLRVGRG